MRPEHASIDIPDEDKTREDLLLELHEQRARNAALEECKTHAERPGAEITLKEREELFRATFEQSAVGMTQATLDGRFLMVNKKYCDITGYSEDELLRMNVADVTYAGDIEPEMLNIKKLLSGELETFSIDKRYVRKNGSLIWVKLTVAPVRDHGTPRYLIGVTEDITGRKVAEESLEKYRLFSDNARDIVLFVNRDGRILEANKAAIQAYGYSRDELLSMTIYDLRASDPGHRIDNQLDTAFNVGILFETVHRRKDGSLIPVEVSSQGQYIHDKKVLLSVVRDISERKRAEKDLRLTQFSIDRAADIALWLAPDGHFIYANDAACKAFGYTREEFLSLTALDTNPAFNETSWMEHWDEVKKHGSFTLEAMLKRKDGSFFPGEIMVNYLVYEGKEYNCSFIRDITERKRLEGEFRLAQFSVEKASDEIFWMESDGRVSYVNDAACRVLGYSRKELQGMYVWDFDPTFSAEKWLESFTDLKAKGFQNFETRHKTRDGRSFPVEITANYVEYDGRAYSFAFVRDIAERKRWEKELLEAKAQAELYIDLMGHDINNMNQISMGFIELAQNMIELEGKLDENNLGLLEKSMDALRDSSRLIDNVRKLQRERKGMYEPQVIDVGRIMQDAVKPFEGVPGRNIRIACCEDSHCLVQANSLLKDVFVNLIGNAVKHSRGDLSVNIRVSHVTENGKKYCRVDVEDDGPGIPDELKATLFDRLNLTSARAKGKGFGLCLIKMLVDDYYGKFWAEDRVKGDYTRGARFVVMLPAADQ